MNKESNKLKTLVIIYLCVELILGLIKIVSIVKRSEGFISMIGFLITLLSGIAVLIIFLCYGKNRNDKKSIFLFAAMMATLFGDVFLCILDGLKAPSLLVNLGGYTGFAICEVFLAMYLGMTLKNNLARAIVFAAFIILFLVLGQLTPDRIPIVLSFAVLTVNEVVGWIRYHSDRNRLNLLTALSITGIFICDYAIMARSFIPKDSILFVIVYVIVWLAYVPFEMLLTVVYSIRCSE